MLPEELSNSLCSLRPREERPCLAVEMVIDGEGKKLRHRFMRGLMRSAARLTYEQVQAARDGRPDDATGPLLDGVLGAALWRLPGAAGGAPQAAAPSISTCRSGG